MRNALKNSFPPFRNEESLRAAIGSVCAKYGTIKSLRILPPTRGPDNRCRCTCFLRLDTEEAQARMMKELDGFNFGEVYAFFVDVDESCTTPTM